MQGPENKENKDERRLGLRVDTKTFERLLLALPQMKLQARREGERLTQQLFVDEAINRLLDFKERRGDELTLAVEEIVTSGNARHRRALEVHVRELLEEVRSASEKRQPKQGA